MHSLPLLVLVLAIIGLGCLFLVWLFRKERRQRTPDDVFAIVSHDGEGWVLLDWNGDTLPWPDDWPDACEVDSLFFAGMGWKRVNLGSAGNPKEGWINS